MKVGRFAPPPAAAPVPLERLIEEGMLIADQALRMTLKNAIIVAALRDRTDLDRDALATLAIERATELAAAERASAARDRGESGDAPRKREKVRTGLAAELEALSADPERLAAMVERARLAAWEEIADPLADRAAAELEAERALAEQIDPRDRAERLAAFLALDLSELAAERGVDLEG